MRRRRPTWTILLLGIGIFGTAAASPIEWAGAAKHFWSIADRPGAQEPVRARVRSRLRVAMRWEPWSWTQLEAAYDLIPELWNDPTSQADVLFGTGPSYRVADPRKVLYPPQPQRAGFHVRENLDRLNVQIRLPWADLIVGRQSIAFGSARLVNPTDVLAPFAAWTLDQEERPGVDALRVRVPLGDFSELDLGLVAGKNLDADASAGFLRIQTQWLDTDVAVLLERFQRHRLIGWDLSRSLGGASAWIEGAWTFPADDAESFLRLSLGADYYFSEVYTTLEYHFNGIGATTLSEYPLVWNRPIVPAAGIFLSGRHYLGALASYSPHPLWTTAGTVLSNLNDGSLLLLPRVEYNPQSDLYWDLGVVWGVRIQSGTAEFGESLRTVYTAVRFYF